MKPSELANSLRSIASKIDKVVESGKVVSASRVAADLNDIVASVSRVSAGTPTTQPEWEKQFYGRSGTLSKDQLGSQLYWTAFHDLNMRSWTPVTNVDQVEQKLRELCVKYNIKDVESEVRRMRKNYAQYKKVWEQKYIKESSPMNVMFTTMDDTTKGSAKMVPFRDLSIRKYLAAPNNAVVVQTNKGQTLTIWNAGSPNDIYYQVGELEDPGDAEGPDAIKRTIDMCFMRYIQET